MYGGLQEERGSRAPSFVWGVSPSPWPPLHNDIRSHVNWLDCSSPDRFNYGPGQSASKVESCFRIGSATRPNWKRQMYNKAIVGAIVSTGSHMGKLTLPNRKRQTSSRRFHIGILLIYASLCIGPLLDVVQPALPNSHCGTPSCPACRISTSVDIQP